MLDVTWDALVLLSSHGPHLIEGRTPIPDDVQHRYWSRSMARLRLWRKTIQTWSETEPTEAAHETLQNTLHSLFTSEVLTRLTGTLFEVSDLRRQVHNAGPIARNVYLAHLEVRQLALKLLLNGIHLTHDRLVRLDTLRRRAERWSDLLIGHLVVRYGVTSYAVDCERARDFGSEQLRTVNNAVAHQQLWDLYRLSLRSAFEPYVTSDVREDQFRQDLVSALFGWLPETLFTQTGAAQSPWVLRFLRTLEANDLQDVTSPTRRLGNRNRSFLASDEEF